MTTTSDYENCSGFENMIYAREIEIESLLMLQQRARVFVRVPT